MSLVLTEVEDGVTAVDELSVNQYKTAIETLAGAGWDDSAGDLDVEELSDAVKTPGDGLEYAGGNLAVDLAADSGLEFSSGDLRIAAAAAGDGIQGGGGAALAVDVSDFAGTGLEDDGSENLRIAAAAAGDGIQGGAGSALAIDVSDFAGTGLEDDGSENLRIAAAAAGAGLGGGGGSALSVNVDDSTIEIPVDTLQVKDAGITVAKMAAGALSEKGNTAGRPAAAKEGFLYVNTQTVALERDTGAAFEEVTGLISAANVTDLTDGGVTNLHFHEPVGDTLYRDQVVASPGSGEAAAMPEYSYLDPGAEAYHDKIRFHYIHDAYTNHVVLDCLVRIDVDPSPHQAFAVLRIYNMADVLKVGGTTEITEIGATYENIQVSLDVSGLAAGLYTVEVQMYWYSDSASGSIAYMKGVVVRCTAA